MIRYGSFPEPNMDPPDEGPEPPDAEGACENCGKEDWGSSEMDDETARASCQTMLVCQKCEGLKVVASTGPEAFAKRLQEDLCPLCEGSGKVQCEGQWSKDCSPPEPPDRDD